MKSLLSVAVLAAMTSGAFAAGTTAGTTIDNTAVISYSVSSVAQTPIESSGAATGNTTPGTGNGTPTQFKVDKKIDLTVTGGNTYTVPTNASGQVSTFLVKNTGNSNEDFKLATAQVATSAPNDVFNTSACSIEYPLGTVVTQVPLNADETKSVTVKCTTPANDGTTVVDGAKSQIDLKATAVDGTGAVYTESATDSADPLTVDVVLADALGTATDGLARNASHSAVNTYQIATADLTVKKTSQVIWDPLNLGTNPKRIPGAEIEYTITVVNAGSTAATALSVSDDIPTNMTYKASSCTADSSGVCATTGAPVTNVSATGMSIAAGATGTMTFIAIVD